jgi:hypothetical protein
MRSLRSLFIIFLVALFAFSCSDKKNNPTENQEQPPEQISAEPITLPQTLTQSQDQHAQMVNMYVQMLNQFQGFANSLIPRNGVGKVGVNSETLDGPPWVYTWNSDSLNFKLVITIENDQYHWKLSISGTSYGHTFADFVYMEAWQSLDGKSGKLILHDFEEGNNTVQWTWNIDANGTETIEYTDSYSGTKIQVTQKADKSGTLKVWQNNVLTFQATWTGAGSGTWITYDENGNQTASGSWG